jgi:hypothetical protein
MKSILVEELYRIHGRAKDTVPVNISLEFVVDRFARKQSLRVVCIVDAGKQLSGVLTLAYLMKWAHLQFAGGKGKHKITISELFLITNAKEAMDLVTTSPHSIAV